HSFVEYPLRTGAIMAIFAFACALLIEPLAFTEDAMMMTAEPSRANVPRKLAESLPKTTIPLRSTTVSSTIPPQSTEILHPLPRQPGGRWGEEIEWPPEWQQSKVQTPANTPPQSGEAGPATATTEGAKNR